MKTCFTCGVEVDRFGFYSLNRVMLCYGCYMKATQPATTPQDTNKPVDYVNKAPHYTSTSIEPIDVIETWGLGFHLGNVVKYIARHKLKHKDPLRDLKKAKWYLDREIARLEKENAPQDGKER